MLCAYNWMTFYIVKQIDDDEVDDVYGDVNNVDNNNEDDYNGSNGANGNAEDNALQILKFVMVILMMSVTLLIPHSSQILIMVMIQSNYDYKKGR